MKNLCSKRIEGGKRMARGARRSYEEQLSIVDKQMERCQQRMNKLKEEREAILEQKCKNEMRELYQLLQEQNISVDDAMKMIVKKESA